MSWFRVSSLIFVVFAVPFSVFPHWSNEISAVGYVFSGHSEDWTQLLGLACFGFAVLLNEGHRSPSEAVHSAVARGVLAFSLPCALLMTYWQLIPDRLWFRLDIFNLTLLYVISYGMLTKAKLGLPRRNAA